MVIEGPATVNWVAADRRTSHILNKFEHVQGARARVGALAREPCLIGVGPCIGMPLYRQTDRHNWKHYLPVTSFRYI